MFRILLFSLGILGFTLFYNLPANHSDTSAVGINQVATPLTKPKKNNQISERFKKILEPVIEFKNAIEPHLPQKEVRTAKRLVFRVLLIARQYL